MSYNVKIPQSVYMALQLDDSSCLSAYGFWAWESGRVISITGEKLGSMVADIRHFGTDNKSDSMWRNALAWANRQARIPYSAR